MGTNRTEHRELTEPIPQVLFRIDRQGGFAFANPADCQAFGYRPDELPQPMTVLEFFAPEDRARLERGLRHIWGGQPMAGEHFSALHRDGSTFPVLVSAAASPSGLIGVILDMNAIRRPYRLLEKSEERYRQLLETMNEGFAIVDSATVLTYVNTRLREMLGYGPGELEGKKVEALLDRENQKVLRRNYVKRRRGRSDSYELAWTRKDGVQLATIMSPKPVYDDDGAFIGSYSVITDVTLLKRTEEALRQREHELEAKTLNLEEANAALKVLLKRREEDKREFEERIMANVRELVAPYVGKLKRSRLGDRQRAYLNILENNLADLTAPFVDSLSRSFQKLTPAEIRVAAMVREGRTTKQIADILALSPRTVEFHRDQIRRKLGLSRRKTNLRSFLLSLR